MSDTASPSADCCLCDMGFDNFRDLARHVLHVHASDWWQSPDHAFLWGDIDKITCCCGREFWVRHDFAEHLEAAGGMAAHLAPYLLGVK